MWEILWNRPLVWAAVAFAAGILWAEHRPLPGPLLILSALAAGTAWGVLLWRQRGDSTSRSPPAGPLGLAAVLFALLGHLTALTDPVRTEAEAVAPWLGRRVQVEALVAAAPEWRGRRQSVHLRLRRLAGRPMAATVVATLPASAPAVAYGDVVALHGRLELAPDGGNPGEPSRRLALRRRGVVAVLRPSAGTAVRIVRRGEGRAPVRWILTWRDRIVRPLLALPEPYGRVLAGLLLGASVGIPPEVEEAFQRAGLLHVLVVSGTQVGLVGAAALAVAGAMRLGVAARAAVAALAVLVFATMVGWSASVGRAAVMAWLALAALALRRQTDWPSALAAAALIWLAASPQALFGLSFQLSFAATWGLLALAPLLTLPLRPRWLAHLVAATLGAQVAVLPLLAAAFQWMSLAAFPANVLVLPLVTVLVPAGFALTVLAGLLPPLATLLVPAFLPPVWLVVHLARFFARAPGSEVWLPPVAWWQAALAYAALLAMPALHRAKPLRPIVAVAGAAALLLGAVPVPAAGPPTVLLAVLDVGQGDAILLRGPGGRSVLVDGGGEVEYGDARGGADAPPGLMDRAAAGTVPVTAPRFDVGRRRVIPALRHLGVRRLDAVVLTHAHEDHVGGLPAVVAHFPVGVFLDPGVPHPSPAYVRVLDLVRERRISAVTARRGQRLLLGGGAEAEVLWPPAGFVEQRHRRTAAGQGPDEDLTNAASVVLQVRFAAFTALLTGDVEAETEEALVRLGLAPSVMLKVAHHGSRTSTTAALLAAVRPRVAVISVGADNLFGHPHPSVVRRLEDAGVATYRTDLDGAVLLRSDGARWWVETVRRREGCVRYTGRGVCVGSSTGSRRGSP